jgi:predicted secreted protein
MRVLLLALGIASAPPVGPLPKGPTIQIAPHPGKTFTVKLPMRSEYVWRIARPFDSHVVREVAEGDRAGFIWVRFRAVAPGTTKIVFAQTRGETRKAYAARTFRITVRR